MIEVNRENTALLITDPQTNFKFIANAVVSTEEAVSAIGSA